MPDADLQQPKTFTSEPIKIDFKDLENKFSRADLHFYGIDHSGASFEVRLYLDREDADKDTPTDLDNKYVGSFNVFGHGGCFGDAGHCEIKKEPRVYDLRASHPLTPFFTRVIITEGLRKLIEEKKIEFKVTLIPVITGGDPEMCDFVNVLKFQRLELVTYD